MGYDFYIQGLPHLNDGSLILSLSKSELDKVVKHPYLKTAALENMLKSLTLDSNSNILTPNKMREYIPLLKEEIAVIKKTFPNTEQNPMIQNNFYLDQALYIFEEAAEVCSTRGRNFIVNQTAENVNSFDGAKGFVREYNCDWARGICSIYSVTINYGNIKTDIYSGLVAWSDNIEGCNAVDKWVAHPTPTNANINTAIIIRPVEINNLSYKYDFTMLSDFDDFLRKHIEGTINDYKKKSK